MDIIENIKYREDISYVAGLGFPWERLNGRSVVISGATGLIGSFLIDVIMWKNLYENLNCNIYALGRNKGRAIERFACYSNESTYKFIQCDINETINIGIDKLDYVIHLASNTHPIQYATDPIGTITTNIIGTKNMIELGKHYNSTRCVFASSIEIYGKNRGDVEKFGEEYCGYIDCNTLRAGYPESKRCGEALCQAYIRQNHMDIVIPRFTRTYGPTLLDSDSKAISQFIHKGVNGENIELKSKGNQYYSFLYVADSVAGLIAVMLNGVCSEAYNISDEASDITLADLASMVADISGTKVVFNTPDSIESIGFSKATKARMENLKLQELGWRARYNIREGLERTIDIMRKNKRG